MKRAVILHGTGGSGTDYFWFADTKLYLESKGYEVWWPELPNTNDPDLEESTAYLLANMPELDSESIVIAHSSACPLVLHALEQLDTRLKQAVLVSGYYTAIENEAGSMLPPDGFDWDVIRQKCDEFVLINSDNDPRGCDDKQARPAAEKLGAKFILAEGQGHMGSGTFGQPYREFSLLKELLAV